MNKKVEKLIEEKIEKKTSDLKQKIRDQEKEIKRLKKYDKADKRNNNRKEKLSRRSFLKKLGAGAIGLSALTLPGAALDIKDSNLEVFTGSGKDTLQKYLTVNQDGPVEITNTSLQIKDNTALHAGNLSNYDATQLSGNNGTNGQILQTDGNNTTWTTIDTSAPVNSVNGQTGTVTLNYNDVGAKSDSYTAPVDSVNGQTGAVSVDAGVQRTLVASGTTFVDKDSEAWPGISGNGNVILMDHDYNSNVGTSESGIYSAPTNTNIQVDLFNDDQSQEIGYEVYEVQ